MAGRKGKKLMVNLKVPLNPYPRATSFSTASSIPLSDIPTCRHFPTPLPVIFQSSSLWPISASSS
uniref:Uncharacterized protein n=1 Tax=Rhizophora mucronata TaxID=61149 RepID=A0A2P2KH87_RHIMU